MRFSFLLDLIECDNLQFVFYMFYMINKNELARASELDGAERFAEESDGLCYLYLMYVNRLAVDILFWRL